MRLRALAAAVGLFALTGGCGEAEPGPSSSYRPGEAQALGAPAVWRLSPESRVTRESTTFTALVSRLDCSGGETGTVLAPGIRATGRRVVVTFAVRPLPEGKYTCPGNKEVAYEVALDQPLGDRVLFDGQCLYAAPAMGTASCDPSGKRYEPGSSAWKPFWMPS